MWLHEVITSSQVQLLTFIRSNQAALFMKFATCGASSNPVRSEYFYQVLPNVENGPDIMRTAGQNDHMSTRSHYSV